MHIFVSLKREVFPNTQKYFGHTRSCVYTESYHPFLTSAVVKHTELWVQIPALPLPGCVAGKSLYVSFLVCK